MASRGQLRQLGATLYRLYVTAYAMVLGFGVLGDLNAGHTRPLTVTTRATAVVGAVLVTVVVAATWLGRIAVALRPSPAEVQLAVLSPVDRSTTLARPIGFTATAAIFASAGAGLVVMLAASAQFAGLSVGIELAYIAFAVGIGLVAYGGHLLVAERRQVAAGVVGVALAGASLFDVMNESSWSPVTVALRDVRGVAPLPVVLSVLAAGVLLVWRASVGAEAIELEKISRGSDLADSASVAVTGNDIRTLLILQRSMGVQPWRARPLFRLSPRLARRLPVFARALRGVARWRIYRWLFVIAMSTAAAGLLRVQPASVRTTGLAAVALWLLGLAVCESFAQEHDRADRLAGLPMERRLEFRQIGTCWLLVFLLLLPACAVALAHQAGFVTAITLAAASSTGATFGSCVSLRRVWKPVTTRYANNPALVGSPFAGSDIVFNLVWPVLVAAICIGPWAAQGRGPALLASSVLVCAGFSVWLVYSSINAFFHRLVPTIVPPPQ